MLYRYTIALACGKVIESPPLPPVPADALLGALTDPNAETLILADEDGNAAVIVPARTGWRYIIAEPVEEIRPEAATASSCGEACEGALARDARVVVSRGATMQDGSGAIPEVAESSALATVLDPEDEDGDLFVMLDDTEATRYVGRAFVRPVCCKGVVS